MAVLRFFYFERQRRKKMSLLWFFIGLWIGAIVGIATMCLMQISKNEREG